MYGSLDISTSGMVAQRTRLAVISSNIANAQTRLGPDGGYAPYGRREAMFEAVEGGGVRIADITIDTNFELRHDPDSPYAVDGYVKVPNVNSTSEQINALEASRAYEANVTAAETAKGMVAQALRLLA
ncbi:MAG: flagellar basal-body rod protein FlgC [Phycisphaerales bacterium]|jgi:flagellar basal-body rod protein FlgC